MLDISIIIPTLNRGRLITGTLEAAANVLDRGKCGEILVVDSSSNEQTAAVFHEVKAKFPRCEWRYFYEPMPGLLSGRHRGANEARGKILSYVDDDVLLAPSWLEGLQEAFADPDTALASGPTRPRYEVDPPEWLDELWQEIDGRRALFSLSLLDSGKKARIDDPLFVLGHNFSIRRDVFWVCGGFHPDIGPPALQRYQGDGETGLTLKVKAGKFRALYHPEVAVEHVIPRARLTPEYFERRSLYQGVCDSFTSIRREGAVRPQPVKSWKAPLRHLRSGFSAYRRSRQSQAQAIRDRMTRAHAAGFAWHQNEVRNDPSLLQWVVKANYLDYSLPDGWQGYFKPAL